jgi:hypothetical protein
MESTTTEKEATASAHVYDIHVALYIVPANVEDQQRKCQM